MHYLLGRQQFYFPSSDDPSYLLRDFLKNKCTNENHLPMIVKISSLNIPMRSIKNLLGKNTPLLLLDTYQLESILAEYNRSNDSQFQSNKRRMTLTPHKFSSMKSMKKLSKSLVTLSTTNPIEENSDDDQDNTRTIIRSLQEKHSTTNPLCRVPMNYRGFFELLNANDQSIEPFHQLSDLLIVEYTDDQIRKEKWPEAFFLRSTCAAYTKRYIPDERKHSGSADSCYGSLSDLDSHRNLLILNDERIILQPGQIIIIQNLCLAYSTQTTTTTTTVTKDIKSDELISQSSTSWIKTKSRFFFSRKKHPVLNPSSKSRFIKRNVYDISKKPQPYLKCQTEQGDIVYIALHETGLFSPLNSQIKTTADHSDSDISGVFQLKDLMSNFRFPLSVRLLNNLISFDNVYSPASLNQSESSSYVSTKFRLLLPYTEEVVFACPLILPSSFKSQILVLPIPIHSEIEVQRCLNMREVFKNKYFHNLTQTCYQIIKQYQTEFSYIHFPIVIQTMLKRKQPLFKKHRSQSESHIEYYSSDFIQAIDNYDHRKSSEILHQNKNNSPYETLFHRDSFEKLKDQHSNSYFDHNQRQQTHRRSAYYAKIKIDKSKRYSKQQDYDSEDENYRDLDHIYDFIRSGDLTDDVQRIQAKERVFNQERNSAPTLSIPNLQRHKYTTNNNSTSTMKTHRFSCNLDDSRPYENDDEYDDAIADLSDYQDFEIQTDPKATKHIIQVTRRS